MFMLGFFMEDVPWKDTTLMKFNLYLFETLSQSEILYLNLQNEKIN